MMTDEVREMRNAVIVVLVLLAAMLLSLVFVPCAKAEVVAYHLPWRDGRPTCPPCEAMKPIERQVIRDGYPIRCCEDVKEAARLGATRFPTFLNVVYEADGTPIVLGRIVGVCSAGQLRRLSVVTATATVGAATRNALRAIVSPTPLLEW
jgi:hypothetical protein